MPGYIPESESPLNNSGIGATEDDISLLWLALGSDTQAAVDLVERSGTEIGLGQIFYGRTLRPLFDRPGLPPNGDPRTPDIVVQPNYGVVYTGSTKKQSEHGGFSYHDTNVMLLLSHPTFDHKTVTAEVQTAQIAPTILHLLGLDPQLLEAVQLEGTSVLPGLQFNEEGER